MSFSDAVVPGEAIESDNESEVEFNINNTLQKGSCEFQGTVYSGEAPESDDEILALSNVKLGKAQEVTEVYKPSPSRHPPQQLEQKSILQNILVDCNKTFWHHLNLKVQSTVVTASSQILASEEMLIQSQLKLQAASRSLKQANDTADQVLAKLQDILTSDFLPDINIPN